jgi:hypothetical protein
MELFDKYQGCIDPVLNKTSQSSVVLKQMGRRYSLLNPTNTWKVTKVTVENCITKNKGEKGCEAILIAQKEEQKPKGYYVELKGCSVGDAFKQIENSLNKTVGLLKNVVLFGRVVPSEYKRNKFLESQEQRLILRFKKLGGNFMVRENCEDTI